jgi:hypothetical protein
MIWQFPRHVPQDRGESWVSISAATDCLEGDIPYVWLTVGPFTLVLGANVHRFRPARPRTRKQRRAKWFEWGRTIHKMDEDEAREYARNVVP